MSSLFSNPLIKTAAIKMAKKLFAENGTVLITIRPDGDELKINEYKEPCEVVTVAKLNELVEKINSLSKIINEQSKLLSND